jgi:hypothetical protein
MQAGLAMMANKDPNALGSLGQGGLRGLEAYTQEMREGRMGERQGIQDEITIRRAQTEEAYRRGIITNQERQLRLAELRAGEAAGERREARSERTELRREQLQLSAEQNARQLLPTMMQELRVLNEQIAQTPAPRDPNSTRPSDVAAMRARQELIERRDELRANADEIRRAAMRRPGLNPYEGTQPAPTQNTPGLPPGARSTPLFPR